ncbi:3-oxoacyl-ACP synthase III family protein [Pseudofrankia inefficax]|uniref:Beta-ketoacyl-acyl-carrier-protein synthase I n=1 Tax=Pseudofrankia inefficax (strain DSM 45817 / CECT 9037 / DDB 130130 / EuI1c) TaxID=298654 RepID=E3JBU4_PSEI1|nr:3-oxoacyl-ACP synthase III family protein [Pseudofrankia inefficax]ADP82254.1 Beta-ketoacyl-acyl-carrier-protein synthase I [Pseudofrankia inefficax]
MTDVDVNLLGVGTALPGPPITNADLTARFGLPGAWQDWIDEFVGTKSRHFSVDLATGERLYTLVDLGELAGRRALEAAATDPAQVDLVVMSTSTPDQLMPATVNMVADRLGIDGVPTYQLQAGCTGAVQTLDLAARLLSTGRYRTALVLGGDSSAKHFDISASLLTMPPEVQVNGMLFGDGVGAAVLSAHPAHGAAVLRHVVTRLEGLGRAPGQVVEWFGWGDRASELPPVSEDFKAVERAVPTMTCEAFEELLAVLGWARTDIDFVLPPQLSGKMTARILEQLAVPYAQDVSCVTDIGNTGNALAFFQLQELLKLLAPGDRAVGVSIEASKWVKAGYAIEIPAL